MDEFTTRKLESSGSLGGEFKRAREEKRFSLKEASEAINIRTKYLEAIENDDFTQLPARVYALNFLKAYARFLGLEERKLVKRYTTELEVRDSIQERRSTTAKRTIPVRINPFVLKVAMALLAGGFALFYVASRLYGIFSPPIVHITHPEDEVHISEQGSLVLKGAVERSSSLTVNGEPVYIDDNGRFSQEVFLSEGVNTFELVAVSRFNKETKEHIKITFVRPQEEDEDNVTSNDQGN